MFPLEKFRENLRLEDLLRPPWLLGLECRPRLLVVTDGLNFRASDGFGLSEFVQALRSTTVHGMSPIVTTAHRSTDPDADLQSFDFVVGLRETYDVMFLFGADRSSKGPPGTAGNLPQAEVDAIAAFMNLGKGVFATGDHEDLGAALCGNLPRVRQMRLWFEADGAPPAASTTRITTNSPGDDGVFQFADQSDHLPQKIYPRYYGTAAASAPHAVLQAPPLVAGPAWCPIEVAPDHPHEGEIVVPAALVSPATIGTLTIDEWPSGATGQPAPEIIAYGMTYGGGFPGKDPVRDPRAFGVIGAWDGHAASVGRVAVDSTWHHFININIDGTGSGRDGLKPGGTPGPALELLYMYWRNLANWLMPRRVRRCLVLPRLADLLLRYPLFEELPPLPWPPGPDPGPGPDPFELVGAQVIATIRQRYTPGEAASMLDDLRSIALGRDLPVTAQWVDDIAVGALACWLRRGKEAPADTIKRARDNHKLLELAELELAPEVRRAIRGHQHRVDKQRDALIRAAAAIAEACAE